MTIHPSDVLAPVLRKLSLWQELGEADRDALLSLPVTRRSLNAGSHIVRQGDRPTHSCALLEGFAFRQKVVRDGGRQILALQIPGDMVDLQNSLLRVADHSVQTLSPAEVAFIPREAIQELAFRRPAIGMAMWYDTLVDGSIHREWTTNIGRRDARARVAHILCEFGVRLKSVGLGDLCRYELPMTQEQLADATALTAVHVNRTLMSLDKEGLTERNRRSVVIQDWEKLASAGDFTPDYLHLPGQGTDDG